MQKKDDYEKSLTNHYSRPNLNRHISEALEKAGRQIASYKDAISFDQFHMRGQEATRELAGLAALGPEHHVLDLGCGIGGAARLLSAEFGCRVTGLDLIEEFVQTATELTRKAGLADRVCFRAGNMLDLPFEADAFDVVWSQHTLMNIEDKSKLLSQTRRVLRPYGRLALYEVAQGSQLPIHYPVQWATDASLSFLLPADQLKTTIEEAGFKSLHWQEVTEECRHWFQNIVAKMTPRPAAAPPPLGLNLVIGPTTAEKARNTARNLEEARIRVFYGLFESKTER
jgi:ubiquinone/menaquinone biosynthesis C-methylase UbiE